MARKIGDLCFPSGKYVKDGEEKTRWMNVGILLETDKGMRIKLEAIPIVTDQNGLWLSVFEPREQAPRAAPKQESFRQPAADPNEDVPF
jgi:hypothetical protein